MEDVLQKFLTEVESPKLPSDAHLTLSNEDDFLRKDHEAFYQFLKCKDLDGDIKLKKLYGIFILAVLGLWEIFVIFYMVFQIFICPQERLSDTSLIALLTSATANILVLPTIVLNYLFPKR